jgi:hypothetical protein
MPVDYLVLIHFEQPPAPDDGRPLVEQTNELMDGLLGLVCDSSGAGWAQVLLAYQSTGQLVDPGG